MISATKIAQAQIPSYIAYLRRRIGPMKVPLIFASACVYDETGRVLWQRRGDFGWWGLPGGVLEWGESLPECVVREVREETGLEVTPTRLIGIYSSPDFDVTYPNGDEVQQVTFCFACRVVGGQLCPDPDETLELAWLPATTIPETAPWYTAMLTDFTANDEAIRFAHGSPGDLRLHKEPLHVRVRQYLDHGPYAFASAVAFIRDAAGRVLLQRRGDDGDWCLIGGALELGERLDQTAVIEAREETGLEVVPERVLGVYSDAAFYHVYPNGDQARFVSTMFECRVVGGTLQPDGVESLELRFFAPDTLPPLPSRHVRRIQDALSGQSCRFT